VKLDELLERVPAPWRAAAARACDGQAVVAEACWHRDDERAEHVFGLPGGPPATLEVLARAGAPQHAARIAAWLAATPDIADVGFKVGHRGLQLYARGELSPAGVAAGLEAAGVDVQPVATRNFLALFEQPHAAMVGLEVDGDALEGAVYTSVLRTPDRTRALRDAFGLLVRIAAPDQVDLWSEAAPLLFGDAEPEIVYVSMSTTLDRPWAKLDVARRPLAIAQPLYRTLLGVRGDAVIESARRLGAAFSHVGVRFGGGMGLTFYLPVHGDDDGDTGTATAVDAAATAAATAG
jgi:hypothetical protein